MSAPSSGPPRVRDEAPELTGSIEADEDLPEQPLVAGRLAARLEDLDRGVGHGPRDVRRRERTPIEPLRRRRTGRGPGRGRGRRRRPGDASQSDVGPGPRPGGGTGAPGGTNSTVPRDLVAGLGQSRTHQPIAGRDTAERGRDEGLRTARLERGGPTRPSRARSGAAASNARRMAADCQPHGARPEPPKTASSGSSDAASRPRIQAGREVGVGQAAPEFGRGGRLAEDEPDPGTVRQPRQRVGLGLERAERRRRAEPDHDVGHALGEALEVFAEPCGHQPQRRALETLDEAADQAEAVLERQPRIALAPLAAGRQADPSAADPEVRDAARVAVQPGCRQQRMKQRETHRRLDGCRSEVAFDPLEDGLEAHQLPGRMQVEELLDERVVAVDRREPVAHRPPGRAARVGRLDPREVGIVDRAVALVATADLVAADRAAVVLVDGSWPGVGDALPDDLVEHHAPPAGGAATGVLLAEPDLEGRLLARGRGDRLEGCVQVSDVGRPEDDLGQEAGQRAGLERGRATLAVHRGPGDPAAPTVQVDDHITQARVLLDPGRDELGWWRRREASERGEREPGLAPHGDFSTGHGPHPATDRPFRRVNAQRAGDVPLGDPPFPRSASRDRRPARRRRPAHRDGPARTGCGRRRRPGLPCPARQRGRGRRGRGRAAPAPGDRPAGRGPRPDRGRARASARRSSPERSPGRSASASVGSRGRRTCCRAT